MRSGYRIRITKGIEDRRPVKTKEIAPSQTTQDDLQVDKPDTLKRAVANPQTLTPKDVLHLQRTHGNQFVRRLLARKVNPQIADPAAGGIGQAESVVGKSDTSSQGVQRSFFGDAWDTVSGAASSVGNAVAGAASSVGNAVSGVVSDVGNAVGGAVNSVGNAIGGA